MKKQPEGGSLFGAVISLLIGLFLLLLFGSKAFYKKVGIDDNEK